MRTGLGADMCAGHRYHDRSSYEPTTSVKGVWVYEKDSNVHLLSHCERPPTGWRHWWWWVVFYMYGHSRSTLFHCIQMRPQWELNLSAHVRTVEDSHASAYFELTRDLHVMRSPWKEIELTRMNCNFKAFIPHDQCEHKKPSLLKYHDVSLTRNSRVL